MVLPLSGKRVVDFALSEMLHSLLLFMHFMGSSTFRVAITIWEVKGNSGHVSHVCVDWSPVLQLAGLGCCLPLECLILQQYNTVWCLAVKVYHSTSSHSFSVPLSFHSLIS